MTHVLKFKAENAFLGGRQVALDLRSRAIAVLANQAESVAIDFSGVRGVSHSFADELLSPLSEMLGQSLSRRVTITCCDPEVEEDLRSVAGLHGLYLPSFDNRELCVA